MSINYYAPEYNVNWVSEDYHNTLLNKHGSIENIEKSIPLIYNTEEHTSLFEHYLEDVLKEELIRTGVRVVIFSPQVLLEFSDNHPEGNFTYAGFCSVLPDGEKVIMLSMDEVFGDPKFFINTIMRHELVHYHQLSSGRMAINQAEQRILWKGECQLNKMMEAANVHLHELNDVSRNLERQSLLPWELEAYGYTYDVHMDEFNNIPVFSESGNALSVMHDKWLDLVIAGDVTPGLV